MATREPIQVTHLWCPESGAEPGENNATHHLVPKGVQKGRQMVCQYCGRSERDLRDEQLKQSN